MPMQAAGSQSQPPLQVLLGIMSNPTKPRLRTQLRQWSEQFDAHRRGHVGIRFVYGSSFHNDSTAPAEAVEAVRSEADRGDQLFVDARERLPHVGVVTEKSAAWWRSIASIAPGYDYYCKSDDDTLVHLDRLHQSLSRVESRRRGMPVYYGHLKWRGWDVGYRFQACGGIWGFAQKTQSDILFGGRLAGGGTYPPCPHAAGPYAYMSGGMVCMSRPLATIVAADAEFGKFFTVAQVSVDWLLILTQLVLTRILFCAPVVAFWRGRACPVLPDDAGLTGWLTTQARNDFGARCRKAKDCAAQGADVRI